MIFLQPFLLWALPAALLPLVIHLLNRMRYHSVDWAAMSFLLSANRASTRHANLRQILILACRVIAVAAFVLMMARPLTGGWLGWMLSPAPETVLILLDRSASTETTDPGATTSRRQNALKLLAEAGKDLASTRFVLFESVFRKPQEIGTLRLLPDLSATAGTDTASDMPGLVDAAVDWLSRNKSGRAELWIVSDLQRSDWEPGSERWPALGARLQAMPQGARVRILSIGKAPAPNSSISIRRVGKTKDAAGSQVNIDFDIRRDETAPASLPVTFTVDGTRSVHDFAMEGQSGRFHHAVPAASETGWGKIELPADANWRDNSAYFVYGPRPFLRSALVSSDEESARFLRLAAAPSSGLREECDLVDGTKAEWDKYALVMWQAPLPVGRVAASLVAFARAGGLVLFFPPGVEDDASFAGVRRNNIQTAGTGGLFKPARWNEQQGPFAKTQEGVSIPLSDLLVSRRQPAVGEMNAWASFSDAIPLLSRSPLGKGQLLFCATLPKADWSNLGEGRVLVPMLQRLLEEAGQRFAPALSEQPGDSGLMGDLAAWTPADSSLRKDPRLDAGVYRNGERSVAVNCPVSEDEEERLQPSAVTKLFAPASAQLFQAPKGESGKLQGEVWRLALVLMLGLLLVEGWLTLPGKTLPNPAKKNPVRVANGVF